MKRIMIIWILLSIVVLVGCTNESRMPAQNSEHIPDDTVSSVELSDADIIQQ